MKHITINRLKLDYFKGVKSLDIELRPVSLILGDNATGKSTIADSFSWLLWGKNMAGESDTKFNIKTLDKDNKVIQKVDHSVECWLTFGDESINIKRVLSENWVKKRGSLETEFTGNTTTYFWNDVPKKQSEYNDKIKQMLDESIFKLITDPLAFSKLHWEAQRDILISIVGEVKDIDIATGNKAFESLMAKLTNKDLEEYKSELASKRKKLNDEIKFLPSRIDEVIKGKPEEADWKAAESKKADIEKELEKIDSQIEDRNKAIDEQAKERTAKSDRIYELRGKNQNIELEVKRSLQLASDDSKLVDAKRKLTKTQEDVETSLLGLGKLRNSLSNTEEELKNTSLSLINLREKWEKENARELKFDEGSFVCPTCSNPLKADDIEAEKEKMMQDFKTDKSDSLKLLNERGLSLKTKETELQQKVAQLESRIKDGETYLEKANKELEGLKMELEKLEKEQSVPKEKPSFESLLTVNKEYQSNIKEIARIQTELDGKTGFDISDLKEKKSLLQDDLREVEGILSKKELIAVADARIKELEGLESAYAQQIADIEREQFVAQEFTIAKVTNVEGKINKMFGNGVSFKMFQEQIEGLKPWCTCLVHSVPYNDVNTAGQIKGGLEIIRVLSEYYGVTAPCFLDSAESITEIPEVKSQIIKLQVSKEHKTLKII